MNKFELEKPPTGTTFIRRVLPPVLRMQVIQNDDAIYDKTDDVFELFEFRGNTFALVVVESEVDLDEVEDFRHIRKIIHRAWKWYRSQVYIEKYTPKTKVGVMEDDHYVLKPSAKIGWWVCADKVNKIVIKWRDRLFDETQKVSELEDLEVNISQLGEMMREMGKWLRENHAEKL